MHDGPERFRQLQADLPIRFQQFADDPNRPYTAVVIPSQTFDTAELAKIDGVAHYEERSLFNLMLLRHPRLEVVLVNSKRLNPLIVDYYLHQIRSVPGAHARRRLVLLDCDDASARPLTQKILERPHLVRRIRQSIRDPGKAHMNVFNSTPLERELALRLDIPLNACDPERVHWGTKTGSRTMFQRAGVPMAPGRHGRRDSGDLPAAIAEVWAEDPGLRRMVVKLDDSFSGEGNACLDLTALPEPADALERERIVRDALPGLRFEAKGQTWEVYREQFDRMGGICEAWLEGAHKTSPSAQQRINPLGEVVAVSTHDQVLGGPSGQVFLGATFPADPLYRLEIQSLTTRVGERLADEGVIGRFAVDYIVADGRIHALEINLRQGGTTHPFNTLKFLTGGRYDVRDGTFRTTSGAERCYFATDNLVSERYRGLLPFDLLDEMVLNGVHFAAEEQGVVFHLLGCLSEHGKVGCTAVARSVDEARSLYERTVEIVDQLAERALHR